MDQQNNIWCCLVMLNEDYALGVAAVAQSLRNVASRYPIWCMATPDISDDCIQFLSGQVDKVIRVPFISHDCVPMKSVKQRQIYGSWIHHSFTKWNIMCPELFPVNKVILIDADMLFLENCDDLFNLTAPAATFSSPWAKPYVQNGIKNPYGKMRHGQIIPRQKIQAGFHGSFLGIANMVLVQPSAESHATMLKLLRVEPRYGLTNCVSGFDEQLLAHTWLEIGATVRHIHPIYNWTVGKTSWLEKNEQPKTLQYYNGKPWIGVKSTKDRKIIIDEGEWDDYRQWWRVIDQIIERTPAALRRIYPNEVQPDVAK